MAHGKTVEPVRTVRNVDESGRRARSRRWSLAALALVLLLAAYVAGYVAMRAGGEFDALVHPGGVWIVDATALRVDAEGNLAAFDDSLRFRFFRPCVRVEEWWRRR